MQSLKQKTYKAFIWDLFGKFVDQGIGFIISIVLARLLAPEEFGLLAMASVVIAMASVFIDSGLGTALIQRKEVTDYHYGSVFYFNILTGSIFTIVFFFLSGIIADFYNHQALKPIMQAISFSFVIDSFTRVQAAWLTKQLKFKILTKARILALVISGTVGVLLAFLGYGVWALVVQSLVSGIVRNLYINFYSGWKPKLIYSFTALKELWGFGLRMFLSGLIAKFIEQMDNLIIGKLFSPAILGYFYRAKSLNTFVVKYTSGSLMPVLFPALSSVQDDNDRFNAIVFKSLHVLSFITFGLIGGLYLEAFDIIVVLFGDKWMPAVDYFQVLLLSAYAYPLSSLLVNILSSKGNSKAFLKLEIIKQTFFVINLIVGFHFGIFGYLYGYAISVFIAVLLNIFFAAKEIKSSVGLFIRIILNYAVLSIVLIILFRYIDVYINLNNWLHLIFTFLIYMFLYIFVSYMLRFKGLDYIYNQFVKEIWKNKI